MDSKRSDDLRILAWLSLAVVAGYLFYRLGPILTPFLVAAILAYICHPLVDRLVRHGVHRALAATVVLSLLLTFIAGLTLITVPLVEREFNLLYERLPQYLEWLRTRFGPWLEQRLGVDLPLETEALRNALTANWKSAGGVAVNLLPSLKTGGLAVIAFLVNLVLVPVVGFYFLRDWHLLLSSIEEMIPRRWHPRVVLLAREIDKVLGEFLRGQISVMVLMSAYYSIGLWLVGLEFALPIGLIAGLLVFVPYLGSTMGLLFATLAAFMQFHEMKEIVPVWVVFFVGQGLEGWVVTPWLVGERIGLHPVAVIFALMAFGQLFGFFGVLMALPASAALLVWLRHVRGRYLGSDLYHAGSKPGWSIKEGSKEPPGQP